MVIFHSYVSLPEGKVPQWSVGVESKTQLMSNLECIAQPRLRSRNRRGNSSRYSWPWRFNQSTHRRKMRITIGAMEFLGQPHNQTFWGYWGCRIYITNIYQLQYLEEFSGDTDQPTLNLGFLVKQKLHVCKLMGIFRSGFTMQVGLKMHGFNNQ